MQKLKLTLIPMCIGIILLLFSWYVSYPVSIDSPYDFIYNHISPLYWLGSSILFASFFVIAINTKNNILRWIIAVSTVVLMYSLSYFYYMIPGPDSHLFRSLTEYFVLTGDLSSKPYHSYYQWPLFFMLNKVVTSITGLDLRYFEFMLYGIIGFVLATSLYLYASKACANGYVAVVAFFVIIKYYYNYQWAPFSVSSSLLLLLFTLDSYSFRKREATLATLIIFFSMTLTHAFVPVFFIVYSFVIYIMNKNQKYLKVFLLTLIIYLTMLIYYTVLFFPDLVQQLTSIYTLEYTKIVKAAVASSVAPRPYIDIIAQMFSRAVIITATIVTGLGFIILLIKRKLREIDYAILLTGVLYVGIGFLLPVLGTRAFFIITIPASLGAPYLIESRFRKNFKFLFLIIIILFTFVSLHGTFYDIQIQFQTKEQYKCANFLIDNYNWKKTSLLLSDFRLMHYLRGRSLGKSVIFEDDSPDFLRDIKDYNCVVYTVGIAKSFLRLNHSVEKSLSEFEIHHFNLIYNSGNFSYIFLSNSKK